MTKIYPSLQTELKKYELEENIDYTVEVTGNLTTIVILETSTRDMDACLDLVYDLNELAHNLETDNIYFFRTT